MNTRSAVEEILGPIVDGKFWMKLLGVLMIISGVLQALTIIGIIVAWLPIWLGVLLFQSAGAAEQAIISNDPARARYACDRLRLFFMIQGVLVLIALVFVALGMFMGVSTAILGSLGSQIG
jgi:hypothetical protein